MNLSEFFQRLVIGIQGEVTSSEIRAEMIHSPDSGLHFQEEGGVIFLMSLQFSTGIRNDAEFALFIGLGKNGPKSSRIFVVAEGGVYDERVGPISSWIIHYRFRAEARL